jgi:hypothetical protein
VDDIERAISNLPLPEPSADLDAAVLRIASAQQVAPDRRRIRRAAALLATAACAGAAGFFIGRETAHADAPSPVDSSPPADDQQSPAPIPSGSGVIRLDVPHESLAQFVVAPPRREAPWGRGPFAVRISQPDS